MEQVRLVLYVALAAVLVLIWQAWRAEQQVRAPLAQADAPPSASTATLRTPKTAPAAPPAALPQAPVQQTPAGARVHVETDLLRAAIDTRGADLRLLALKAYPVALEHPEAPYPLLDDTPERSFYVQSGLLGEGAPDHRAGFHAAADAYVLPAGADTLEVPLEWAGEAGLRVRKIYTFERDSYVVRLRYEVTNGAAAWRAEPYAELVRRPGADAGRSFFNPVSFQGGALYTAADKFRKFGYEDMARHPLARSVTDGWVAMTEHYFVAALLPPADSERRCYTRALAGERYAIGCVAAPVELAPGARASYETRLYAGPKEQRRLSAAAPGLHLTVDYGLLTVLAQPLFWLLRTIHGVVHNWGVSIILVTLLIKLAFYHLSATSYRSMAHMRKVQPKMLELRERYKDDRPKLNEKMMELYRSEKVNPLGGCLPIVVQIPVFIALYWVLLESVELRQAPFLLWIRDLASKDPYYVLPILMGATMVLQQRMNPAPLEPMQQRVMMALPVVFTVFFALFPAGLVLYWLANNVLSIAQQWLITRQMQRRGLA